MGRRSLITAGIVLVVIAVAIVGPLDRGREDEGEGPSPGGFTRPLSQRVEEQPGETGATSAVAGEGTSVAVSEAPPKKPTTDAVGEAGGRRRRFVPQRLVIRFRPGSSPEARAAVRSEIGGHRIRGLGVPDAEVIALPRGAEVRAARAAIASSPDVAYAEPDYIYRVSSVVPADPHFSSLWGLHNTSNTDIDAPEAWSLSTGSKDVRVGVVDTGVAYDHPDLSPNISINPGESGARAANGIDDDNNGYVDDVRGWDWVDRDNDPLDLHGHGTHVAGTVGAKGDNGIAGAGVAWDAGLVPLRVLDADGAGSSSSIAAAFSYAGANGLDVVNASLGGPSFSRAVFDAITAHPGTLFVAAAGNESSDNDDVAAYPCNYEAANLLCVAAITQSDGLASFSNFGASTVDLGAPGAAILSTLPKSEVRFTDGFESGFAERWRSEGTTSWGLAADDFGNFLTDSPTGTYLPGTDASLNLVKPFDLGAAQGCRLRFALRLDTEKSRDLLHVEASTDSADWVRVGSMSGSTKGGWTSWGIDLSSFDPSPTTYLRFRLTSDANNTVEAGADIDDVQVRCIGTAYSGTELGTFSGTSMAAPHVAGAAAVLKAAKPSLSATTVADALTRGTVKTSALQGRTVTGGRLNLYRSLIEVAPVPIGSSPSPRATGSTPDPSFTQSEEEPPSEAVASPSPSPSGTIAPPQPGTITPSPSVPPSPSPSPTGEVVRSARSLTVRLVKHVVVRGSIRTAADPCRSGAKVVVKREGARVAVTRTTDEGRFGIRLKDRVGRYVVIAPKSDGCQRAVTRSRHRHGVSSKSVPEVEDPIPVAEEEGTVATTSTDCFTHKRAERRFGRMLNRARLERDRTRIKLNAELSRVARVHTREMMKTEAIFHTPSATLRSRVVGWTVLGENVGLGATPSSLHRAFLASPTHRDNMLYRGFTHVGVGTARSGGRLWVTVVFQGSGTPGTSLRMPSC